MPPIDTLSRHLARQRKIAHLGAVGLFRDLRTVFELSQRVGHLEQEYEELLNEWLDKKDSLDRLLKRLAVRESRSTAGSVELPDPTTVDSTAGSAQQMDKAALRQYARGRGLVR